MHSQNMMRLCRVNRSKQMCFGLGFEQSNRVQLTDVRRQTVQGAEQLKALAPIVLSLHVGVDRRAAEEELRSERTREV